MGEQRPMFAEPEPEPEPEPETPKAPSARGTMKEHADSSRDTALKFQEWTSGAFGDEGSERTEFRVTCKGGMYLLESLLKKGTKESYGYTGVFVHQRDIIEMTKVLVAACRAMKGKP